VGQVASGEIYNQAPTEFRLAGTRRWLPGTEIADVKLDVEGICQIVAQDRDVEVDIDFQIARDGFELDQQHPLVGAFQQSHATVTGAQLPAGSKPFVDDGNEFIRRGGIPAITHGPNARGAHTLNEEVPVDELVRVATVYGLTAIEFCRP